MKYYTEFELAHHYDSKIKSPGFVYIDAAVTRKGLKVAVGDIVRTDFFEGLLYVDSITYEPWNKVEFWCVSADDNGKLYGSGLRKICSEWICKVEKMTDALVYFIREDSGNVKIGVTANLKKRLKAIQTHNPHKMAVVKTIHCSNIQQAKKAEKELHKRFSEFRQNGEWFKLPEPVINELIGEGE